MTTCLCFLKHKDHRIASGHDSLILLVLTSELKSLQLSRDSHTSWNILHVTMCYSTRILSFLCLFIAYYVFESYVWIYVCIYRHQRRAIDHLELKFQEAVSHSYGSENWTWVVWKSSHFYLLSHLSIPKIPIQTDWLFYLYTESI